MNYRHIQQHGLISKPYAKFKKPDLKTTYFVIPLISNSRKDNYSDKAY